MTTRFFICLVAIGAASLLAVRPVGANTTFFAPISGAAFRPSNDSTTVSYGQGHITNNATTAQSVSASLGFAGGGTNGFNIYGYNNGGNLLCSVYVRSISTTSWYVYTAQTIVAGNVRLFVETSPPFVTGSGYLYTVECAMPMTSSTQGPAQIFGVAPDH